MGKLSVLLEKVRQTTGPHGIHLGWAWHLWFPVTFFFWELIFSAFISGGTPFYSAMEMFFSLAVGGALEIVTSLLPRQKGNRILQLCLLLILSLPYIVEYFIHYQFQIFYDVATVRNGAGGVATGFLSDVIRLVFSPSGLAFIVLALLPGILYAVLGLRWDPANRLNLRSAGALAGAALVTFGIARLLVNLDDYSRGLYSDEYNFDAAVGQFGLFTGIRLDLKLGGEQEALEFEPVAPPERETISLATEAVSTEPEETEPVAYGKKNCCWISPAAKGMRALWRNMSRGWKHPRKTSIPGCLPEKI